jgi:hypothetical protein
MSAGGCNMPLQAMHALPYSTHRDCLQPVMHFAAALCGTAMVHGNRGPLQCMRCNATCYMLHVHAWRFLCFLLPINQG